MKAYCQGCYAIPKTRETAKEIVCVYCKKSNYQAEGGPGK